MDAITPQSWRNNRPRIFKERERGGRVGRRRYQWVVGKAEEFIGLARQGENIKRLARQGDIPQLCHMTTIVFNVTLHYASITYYRGD